LRQCGNIRPAGEGGKLSSQRRRRMVVRLGKQDVKGDGGGPGASDRVGQFRHPFARPRPGAGFFEGSAIYVDDDHSGAGFARRSAG
jgi:hypothetical protein